MNVLPERLYWHDEEDRKRFLPAGLHPAKMNVALTMDLIRRYTRPGQTIVDPFLGIGGTGLALLEGRSVVGIELEPHLYEYACRNLRHLEGMARDLGHSPYWEALQGDSQERLLEMRRYLDASVTSPAFGEMNAEHAGGNVKQRPNKDGVGFDGDKSYFTYGGDPRAAVTSPPYADTLNETPEQAAKQRERMAQKIASGEAKHPEGTKWGRRGSWGGGVANRYTQGYNAAATSPPYEDTLSRNRSQEPYARDHPELSKAYGRTDPSRSADGYGRASAQIGNMKLKNGSYQRACQTIYAGLFTVIQEGGVLVIVTGDYVREQKLVDLSAITIELAEAAGWTPVERWRARKRRKSFWRHYWAQRGAPDVDYEDVIAFCKGPAPAWAFTELPPTGVPEYDVQQQSLF